MKFLNYNIIREYSIFIFLIIFSYSILFWLVNLMKSFSFLTFLNLKRFFFTSSINFRSSYLPGIINDTSPVSDQISFDYELRKKLAKKVLVKINNSKNLRRNLNTELINIISKLTFQLIPANFLENFDHLHNKCILENFSNSINNQYC